MSKILSIHSVIETKLYKELVRRNNTQTIALVGNIPSICEEASDRVKILPKFFYEYTLHDQVHFLRVTEIMAVILGADIKNLNEIEIALLILSAFLHDQGMILDDSETNELETSEDYLIFRENWFLDHPNYLEIKNQSESNFISEQESVRLIKKISELESAMLTDYLRLNHGQRSYSYILSNFSNDKRFEVCGVNLSDYLALICLSHVQSSEWLISDNGLNLDENIGRFKVNTIFISLILRLADILDFDSDRTPDVLFKSIHFTSAVSTKEWQKHRDVKGWEISKDLIRYSMFFEHPVYEKTARIFMEWIDYELSQAQRIIRKFPADKSFYKLNIPEKTDKERLKARNNAYIYHDVEFTLSRDEIVKLLLTNNLYKNSSLFIRELLQNSLDALRLRKAQYQKDYIDWNIGKVIFYHYIDQVGQHIVECTDNGCGMDEEIISKFLGKVGRSYYRSPEFDRIRVLLKEKGVDFEPCAQFGIGFMSCFMIGDRIEILTRKDYGLGKEKGKPLIIEINGLGGLIVIKEGSVNQEIGTKIRIYCRETPIIYDNWSDDISLILTIKGYALANEFPIEAICSIDTIKNSIIVPPTIDKKNTFLEQNKISSIKTYEIDLTDINKNLRGFLRQSFFVDELGVPCLGNKEAKWIIRSDDRMNDQKNFKLSLVNDLGEILDDYDYNFREDRSICLDGILVCGFPGRSNYEQHEMLRLGNISSRIYSEHPFTIDIRGNIKPELSPAREPLDAGGIFKNPPGWRKLQQLINHGSGDLWDQVLKLTKNGLSNETFWKLIIVYDGSPLNIFSNSIFKHLKLPTSDHQWIGLSDIKYITIEGENIIARSFDNLDWKIDFIDELQYWGKGQRNKRDFNYWMQTLLLGLSEVDFQNVMPVLKIKNSFNINERPSDNFISTEMSHIRCLKFLNISTEYINAADFVNVANLNNPVIELSFNSYFLQKKNDLQEFAAALSTVVPNLIKSMKEQGKGYTLNINWRPVKYLGAKYMKVNWVKYDSKYKPPYKIFINDQISLEIDDEILKKWAYQEFKPQ